VWWMAYGEKVSSRVEDFKRCRAGGEYLRASNFW